MATEIVSAGIVHSARRSWWDGKARSLCGKDFTTGFREKLIYGSVTCRDCRSEKKAGKRP